MTSLLIMRFLCGVFGSSGPALGVASCADVSCFFLSADKASIQLMYGRYGSLKKEVVQSQFMHAVSYVIEHLELSRRADFSGPMVRGFA